MKKYISKIIPILLLCCIATSIYMRGLLFHISYEYDELFTAITTDPTLPFSWIYKHYLLVDVHPPLYNALMWLYNHVVPYGPEIWLRLPSFLMGVGAIVCAWFCFPKCFGKEARLLFTALISCNAYAIAFSQWARSYMLLLLLAIPYTFLFLHILYQIWNHQILKLRIWLIFGLLALLLIASHYFGVLLFGVFSIVLLQEAVRHKYKLLWVILIPIVVLILFLPWFIPNFINQLHFQRLDGNWWANQYPYWHALIVLLVFWTTNLKGAVAMGVLVLIALVDHYWKRPQLPILAWPKEQKILGECILLFVLAVTLISIRTYVFINRYFLCILPLVYLSVVLFFTPVLRKNIILSLGMIVFLGLGMTEFWEQYRTLSLQSDVIMPARRISQMYRDRFPKKKMFVVALEGFPPVVMPALYGFYVNKIYHLDMPVLELFSLDEQARNSLLSQQKEAVMWMPNCSDTKLYQLAKRWGRVVYMNRKVGTACFLQIEEEEK